MNSGFNKNKLRWGLLLFFFSLAVPTAMLVIKANNELKWEALHQHRALAEALSNQIDARLIRLMDKEDAHSFNDYAFLRPLNGVSMASHVIQRSPLSTDPALSDIPGLIGYFQVDYQGKFSSPLLPSSNNSSNAAYGLSQDAWAQRQVQATQLRQILSQNHLINNERSGLKDARLAKISQQSTVAALPKMEPAVENDSDVAMLSQPNERLDTLESITHAFALTEQPSSLDTRETSTSVHSFPSSKKIQKKEAKNDSVEEGLTQRAFDQLKQPKKSKNKPALGRVADMNFDLSYQANAPQEQSKNIATPQRRARKEVRQTVLSENSGATIMAEKSTAKSIDIRDLANEDHAQKNKGRSAAFDKKIPILKQQASAPIRTFDSEIDPFEFSLLSSGHAVLFRTVWRQGQRYTQGALLDKTLFLNGLVAATFQNSALSNISQLLIAYQGDVLAAFQGQTAHEKQGLYSSRPSLTIGGTLLYQTRLSSPFSELALLFSLTQWPESSGSALVRWLAITLITLLCGGFYLMYRLGLRQINLAQQQQNFISAISHELKTPLTSIRMYGEILREGWASEEKKKPITTISIQKANVYRASLTTYCI